MDVNPLWIPIVALVFGTAMIVALVALVHWYKDLRIREMEHQAKMKTLEIELEKARQKNA
jgi:hypothetical protein